MDTSTFFSRTQIKERYGISDMTLWRWERDEKLKFPKPRMAVRKRKFFHPEDIIAWEESHMRKQKAVRIELPDEVVSGLYKITQPSGAVSFAFRYRVNGKAVKQTIGSGDVEGTSAAVSLREARIAAKALRDMLNAFNKPHLAPFDLGLLPNDGT